MKVFRSKCNTCGDYSYIFPDQVYIIKENPTLKLHKYVKEELKTGSKWFCVKCDASFKNGNDCYIYAELDSKKSKSLIAIRSRESDIIL